MTQSIHSYAKAYDQVVSFLRTSRLSGSVKPDAWQTFQKQIAELSFSVSMQTSIDLWTMENLDQHRPELVRPRILHEIEKRFISSEAYGRMLEAQSLGMLSPSQIEAVLEDIASRELIPVGPEHMQKLIVKIWMRNITGIRSVKAN